MSRYDCPSCGETFNGKKCRNCGYETFNEEIAHRLHVHKGEPLVIHETTRKPIPTADPFGCPPKPKKQPKAKKKKWTLVITIILVLWFLAPAAEVVKSVGSDLSDFFSYISSPAPEELAPDEQLLYSDENIRVTTSWNMEDGFTNDLPLTIYNDGRKSIRISCENLTVNDYLLDYYAYLGEEIKPGKSVSTSLYINSEALDYCGISSVTSYKFNLAYCELQDYAEAWLTDAISVPFSVIDLGTNPPKADDGVLLYEDDNIRLVYRGYETPHYSSSDLSGTTFLIYAENKSSEELTMRSEDSKANDQIFDLWVYSTLPAYTKTIIQSHGYEFPVDSIEALQTVSIDLTYRNEDWDETELSVMLPITEQGAVKI